MSCELLEESVAGRLDSTWLLIDHAVDEKKPERRIIPPSIIARANLFEGVILIIIDNPRADTVLDRPNKQHWPLFRLCQKRCRRRAAAIYIFLSVGNRA